MKAKAKALLSLSISRYKTYRAFGETRWTSLIHAPPSWVLFLILVLLGVLLNAASVSYLTSTGG